MIKRLLTTVLFVFISVCSHSQNWEIVKPGIIYNYKHSDSALISNSIFISGSEFNGNDSVFHLSLIGKRCDTCDTSFYHVFFENTSQFLLKSFQRSGNGKHTFFDGADTININTKTPLNSNWEFSSGVNAKVVSVFQGMLFDNTIQDSLKKIILSNGDSIILSKNYGVVLFPEFNGKYYTLIGINGKNIGEQLPDAAYFNELETGDYFSIRYQYFNGSCGFMCTNTILNTYKIKSMSTTQFGISYVCDLKKEESGYYSCCNFNTYHTSTTRAINVEFSIDHYANDFYPQSFQSQGDTMIVNDGYYAISYLSKNNSNEYVKNAGIKYISQYSGLAQNGYLRKINSERYEAFEMRDFYLKVSKPLSIIQYEEQAFEENRSLLLTGYTKNGIIFGDIDTVLSLGNSTIMALDISIYPSPATNKIFINYDGFNSEVYTYVVYNNLGEKLINGSGIKNEEVDLSNLSDGVYLLKITTSNRTYIKKILLQNNGR